MRAPDEASNRSYFKYLSRESARAVLQNRTLRWSHRSEFNDPFDMQIGYSTAVDAPSVLNRSLQLMWERIQSPGKFPKANQMANLLEVMQPLYLSQGEEKFKRDMAEGVMETLRKLPLRLAEFSVQFISDLETMKVLCLSETNNSVTMWSHYAESHKGLVLEFACQPGLDSVYSTARPISYGDEPPSLLDTEDLARFLAGYITLESHLALKLVLYKSTAWAYEKEWRLISGEGRFPAQVTEDLPFAKEELVGVYFGSRADELRTELTPLLMSEYGHAARWNAVLQPPSSIFFTPCQ